MRTGVLIVCLLALAACAAGCGGSAAADSVVITHVDVSKKTSDLILDAEDIGGLYVVVDGETGILHLKDVMQGDPKPLRQLEKRYWQAGYRALYESPNRDTVATAATVFRTEDAAVKVSNWWARQFARKYHGQSMSAATPNLEHARLIRAPLRSSSGHGRSAYLIQWVHGRVIAQIIALGASGNARSMAQMAQAQDGRITVAG
jgi:hypothetical protein